MPYAELNINIHTLTGFTVIETKERIKEAMDKGIRFTPALVKQYITAAAHTVCQRYNRNDLYNAIVQRLLAETRNVVNDNDKGLSPN